MDHMRDSFLQVPDVVIPKHKASAMLLKNPLDSCDCSRHEDPQIHSMLRLEDFRRSLE